MTMTMIMMMMRWQQWKASSDIMVICVLILLLGQLVKLLVFPSNIVQLSLSFNVWKKFKRKEKIHSTPIVLFCLSFLTLFLQGRVEEFVLFKHVNKLQKKRWRFPSTNQAWKSLTSI